MTPKVQVKVSKFHQKDIDMVITITIKVVNDKANDKDRHKNAPNRKRLDNQRAILTQNGNHQFCVKIRKVEKHNQTYQNKKRFGQQSTLLNLKNGIGLFLLATKFSNQNQYIHGGMGVALFQRKHSKQ